MQSKFLRSSVALAALAGAASAQQYLMVIDSTADKVVLLDSTTGALVNSAYIVDAGGTPYDFSTPKDAFQVGNEVWVVDQLTNQIVRFDLNGVFLAMIPNAVHGATNMRGGCYANGKVYISTDGTPSDRVIMLDTAGNLLGSFSTLGSGTSPFDVTEFNGELLVSHFTGANNTARYDYAGNLLGIFHASTGVGDVNSAEQISLAANNHVLVAGFTAPIGVYEYDSLGVLVASYLFGSGNRGCWRLPNGDILSTDSSGVRKYDVAAGTSSFVYGGTPAASCQYINLLDLTPQVTAYCTAGTSTNGCVPTIGATGTASVSASSGFTINVANLEGQQSGLIFYGINGRVATPWGIGGNSFFCVKAPVERMGVQNSGGTFAACDGAMSADWLAFVAATPGALGTPFSAGATVNAQCWYRDPPAVKTTNLSGGLEFITQP